jgi:hypothetical protein
MAQPIPAAMIPPITQQCAGSGGGGGGDHLDNIAPIPNNDDQGGGGGGGGGAIRISCIGPYVQGLGGPTASISAVGAMGATALANSGAGGSGSGGEIWIQTFSTITIAATAIMDVDGPARVGMTLPNIGCGPQASGGGGDGLIQLEAGTGAIPTPSFAINPPPTATTGAVFVAPPFQFSGGVTGQATSRFRHVGYAAPDYKGAAEVINPGNAPGAVLQIRYEGAHEAVNSPPGNPSVDPATIKSMATGGGPITAANLSELDGYAFIRFVVTVSYPAPPATSPGAILPSVDAIFIGFTAPLNCP